MNIDMSFANIPNTSLMRGKDSRNIAEHSGNRVDAWNCRTTTYELFYEIENSR
jgi:hypothetical protein